MQKNNEITPIEAARKLGVGLDYLYSLIWTGKLPGRKAGNRWRIPLTAVEDRLKERESRNA
jgi:excisionase family DNA binding protein